MKLRQAIITSILIFVSGGIGYLFGQQKLQLSIANWKPGLVVNRNPLTTEEADVDFSHFWRVWDRVSELYVDKTALSAQKMVDGAISGMVASVGDPYTVYLPPVQNKESKEDLGGAFGGVGIQLGFMDKQLAVMTALDGTPAQSAGIKTGDLILHIKDDAKKIDQATGGMSIPEAVKLIRGEKGSKVKLTMFRPGGEKPYDLELTRDTIVVKSVTLTWISENNQKIAWIKLTRFGDRTREEWDAIVSEINSTCKDKKDCRLVLDVRNNPGGYLEMSVYIAGEFLKHNTVVVTQQDGKGNKEENKVDRLGRLLDMPMAVLVNEGSASAAEILSGALSDHKRTKLIGVKTFGKGSVQVPEDFSDGSGIHVTIAKWLRPSGDWIDKKGINPDYEVLWENNTDSANYKDDPQLMKALEVLR